MGTFAWLLLGHLVGDWLLQNDWMAKGKRRGFFTRAGIVHFCLYTATVMTMLWLSDARGLGAALSLVLAATVFISHWLIDATDVVRWWMRFHRQSELEVVRLMVDQTLHLLVLALVAVLVLGV
jgi:Protein of unknown function (DUF3307)